MKSGIDSMTEKRFQWIYIKDNTLELRDNGIVKVFNNERLEELLNDLNDENEQLKSENELLSDELLQCKAVINKKWSEYLQKKGLME